MQTSILCHVASATERSASGYLVSDALESTFAICHLRHAHRWLCMMVFSMPVDRLSAASGTHGFCSAHSDIGTIPRPGFRAALKALLSPSHMPDSLLFFEDQLSTWLHVRHVHGSPSRHPHQPQQRCTGCASTSSSHPRDVGRPDVWQRGHCPKAHSTRLAPQPRHTSASWRSARSSSTCLPPPCGVSCPCRHTCAGVIPSISLRAWDGPQRVAPRPPRP